MCSRDFLWRFDGNGLDGDHPEASHDLELNLSLGGCFSAGSSDCNIQPVERNKLVRSSSIASFSSPAPADDHHEFPTVAPFLMRTSSLPAEHQERRKRKEMQALRRLEAKRKRKEKMNSTKACQKSDEAAEAENAPAASRPADASDPSVTTSLISFRSWTTQDFIRRGIGNRRSRSSEEEDDDRKISTVKKEREEQGRKMVEEMPCVSTRGDGPGGRRIEGFLYKYKKGEDVSIVCVCHGSFLTPAEFVKHAGGGAGAVANPLRHIVVSPTSYNTCL